MVSRPPEGLELLTMKCAVISFTFMQGQKTERFKCFAEEMLSETQEIPMSDLVVKHRNKAKS